MSIVFNDITIATPGPGELNLCSGRAIFPINGKDLALRLGYYNTWSLFNFNVNFLGVGCWGSVGVGLFAGMCGPSWAIKMKLSGGNSGNTLYLIVGDNAVRAGLIKGLAISLPLKFNYDAGWFGKNNVQTEPFIDVIPLVQQIIDLLQKRNTQNQQQGDEGLELQPLRSMPDEAASLVSVIQTKAPSGTVVSNAMSAGGLLDTQYNSFEKNSGSFKATPNLKIEYNMWPLLAHTNVFTEAVDAFFNNKWVMGKLEFGPEFIMKFPVTLKMNRIMIGGTTYTNGVYRSQTFNMAFTSSDPEPVSAENISVEFAETPEIDFKIGFYARVTIFKIFSIGGDVGFDILKTLGFNTNLGTYYSVVDNSTSVSSSSCGSCTSELSAAGIPEVLEVEFA